jgi:hypothetical protein
MSAMIFLFSPANANPEAIPIAAPMQNLQSSKEKGWFMKRIKQPSSPTKIGRLSGSFGMTVEKASKA